MRIFWGLFNVEESQEEKKRRENKELDKKIANKELEIKMLRGLLRERKEKRFTRRMERRKAAIKEVNIAGVNRTSDKLLMNAVSGLFSVENFNDILKTTKEVRSKLKALGVFSKVDMLVDTLPSDPHHYQVRIMVTERLCAPFLHCGVTSPGANVGAAVVTGGIGNITGGGERLSVQLERGSSRHRKDVLNLCVPMPSISESLKSNFYIGQERSLLRPASSQLWVTSLGAGLSLTPGLVSLSSGVNMRWRDNKYCHQLTSSPGVAEWSPLSQHSGHSLRTSLDTSLTLDTRDDSLVPAHGLLLTGAHSLTSNLQGQLCHAVTLKTCLHYCLVRGLSLSWRSLFSGLWSGYPQQPQELHHYPPGLHWRGLEDKSQGPHHLSSILCLTSNLPMITSRSMIGTCEILDMRYSSSCVF